MKWLKIASSPDHGNTYDGERLYSERTRLREAVSKLKTIAANRGPADVIPRFRTDVRRMILNLPPMDRYEKMSMLELEAISMEVESIEGMMNKYSIRRIRKIEGG